MFTRGTLLLVLSVLAFDPAAAAVPKEPVILDTDLLVVGGTEAGVSAAIQAARLGVKRIVLVSDIDWLGGQFSAEGVGAIDEWTTYRGKRTEFARSGMFLEMLRLIRQHNVKKYGLARPGNGFCASETIEPAAAAKLFEEWIQPYVPASPIPALPFPVVSGRANPGITVIRDCHPDKVRGMWVEFQSSESKERFVVRPRLIIDASDWGDVIQRSGAKWSAGPDLESRFGEPNAPEGPLADDRNEMNPISYCLVLREAERDVPVEKPNGYDERTFFGTTSLTATEFKTVGWPPEAQKMNVLPFIDTAYPEGIYSPLVNLYAHRRLVDARHNPGLNPNDECILVNWPTQDYPLYDFPQEVVFKLESLEKGASRKNIVAMTPRQRQIVFDDARRHALGMLHHLQTTVDGRMKEAPVAFRRLELSDEFGTPDRLPPKPYVREGLRLEALYMLREGDIRMQGSEPGWARHMPPDSVFGFQFNIDFHPTRRVFLGGDKSGPWVNVHTKNRNWSTHTDRACFPLRSLIPVEMDGLLGASKNLGVSSIVSSAVRLHGQMMLSGQAAGTVAAIALARNVQPRQIAADPALVREVQLALVRGGRGGPGVLLWPYQDLSPDDVWFEAANMLAVERIYWAEDGVDFQPWKTVSRREVEFALQRAELWLRPSMTAPATGVPTEPADDGEKPATWQFLYDELERLALSPSRGLSAKGKLELTRAELVQHLWAALRDRAPKAEAPPKFLTPGNDADGDGTADLDDALPLDRDNDNLPDRLDP
jgi:hypothetical protein